MDVLKELYRLKTMYYERACEINICCYSYWKNLVDSMALPLLYPVNCQNIILLYDPAAAAANQILSAAVSNNTIQYIDEYFNNQVLRAIILTDADTAIIWVQSRPLRKHIDLSQCYYRDIHCKCKYAPSQCKQLSDYFIEKAKHADINRRVED